MARVSNSNGGHAHGLNAPLTQPVSQSRSNGSHLDIPRVTGPRHRPPPPFHCSSVQHEPTETVPGLACCYGKIAYCYSDDSHMTIRGRSQHPSCHNPVETPEERHECPQCRRCYCSRHASQEAHDCAAVVLPPSAP